MLDRHDTLNRAQALAFAEMFIRSPDKSKSRHYQLGHFVGFVETCQMCGLFTSQDVSRLKREHLLSMPRWWNLAGWLGL